uniref:peptidylprolyl isomerase n=1 Tax=Aphelinus abdominalis TaxID=297830 RepID=A0A481SYN1_9HYME|nr:fk506-binding protein [Aphelinus abdominalis]
MTAMDISVSNDGGLLKEILSEGTSDEKPGIGAYVRVHYTGKLLDGTVFDSSVERGQPFKFELGLGQVIKGWDAGIKTMKKGEKAILTCSPEYAYGKAGSPPNIPPDATLKFEVELLGWDAEDLSPNKDKTILREVLTMGGDFMAPSDGGLVEIHLQGTYNGLVFEERDVKFIMGEGEAEGIIEGVEIALKRFKKGEKSKITIKSKYAFGNAGKPEFNIPANATVEYVVELKNLEKGPEAWSMDAMQKLEQAKMFKERGTAYFKENKFNLAVKMYQKVIEFVNDAYDFKDQYEKPRDDFLFTANLNLALCFLKTKQPAEAKEASTKVLEIDPKNEKALFRRGQAYMDLASPEIAIKDFQEVVKINPNNTAAIKQVAICNNIIKTQLAKEKKLYANMFEKFAKSDLQ